MPRFKMNDSIGSCAMNFTCTPDTGSGTYTYKKTKRSTNVTTQVAAKKISSSNMQYVAATNGWTGSAAVVNIPENDSNYLYSDYKASYQYSGKVAQPKEPLNFNSIGTYAHTKVVTAPSASIEISISEKTATIGLSLRFGQDRFSAFIEDTYTP